MIQLFYTHRKLDSEEFIREIFFEYFALSPARFLRTKNGKPYLENAPHFSVTHSGDLLLVAVSAFPVGVDAEDTQKKRNYSSVLRRFSPAEREEITDTPSFLRNWTAKESYVKLVGGTLIALLPKLTVLQNTLYLDGEKKTVTLTGGAIEEKYIFSLCSEKEQGFDVIYLK